MSRMPVREWGSATSRRVRAIVGAAVGGVAGARIGAASTVPGGPWAFAALRMIAGATLFASPWARSGRDGRHALPRSGGPRQVSAALRERAGRQ